MPISEASKELLVIVSPLNTLQSGIEGGGNKWGRGVEKV